MSSAIDDLSVTVSLEDGRQVTVHPVRVAEVTKFARAVAPMWDHVSAQVALVKSRIQDAIDTAVKTAAPGTESEAALAALETAEASSRVDVDLFSLLVLYGDEIIKAVAIGARLDEADLRAMALDDMARLMGAVLQVNVSFFALRVKPALDGMIEKATATFGRQLSTASQAVDTAV
jgi:hypothetical protein